MYKPHTIEQYKVYRFLEENFALEHFLLAPLSRFGLMLEDKTGEKIAFAFLNDCVQEIPVPAPSSFDASHPSLHHNPQKGEPDTIPHLDTLSVLSFAAGSLLPTYQLPLLPQPKSIVLPDYKAV